MNNEFESSSPAHEDTTTVLELSVSNAIGIHAATIRPEPGEPVMLTGANEAGKSSILWALECFKGKKFQPQDFIRHGAEKAVLELKTSRWEAKLVVTPKTERLEVRAPNGGATYSSPQTILNSWFGDVSFDPLAFKGMQMGEQVRIIRELSGLDLSSLDAAEKERSTDQTIAGRELKSAQAVIERLRGPEHAFYEGEFDAIQDETVSPQDILNEIDLYETHREQHQQYRRDQKFVQDQIREIQYTISVNEDKIAELQAKNETLKVGIADANQLLQDMKVPDCPSDYDEREAEARQRLRNLEKINEKINAKKDWKAASHELEQKVLALNEVRVGLEGIREQRRRALADAKYPIKGLTITEEGAVTYKDVRIDQLSDGQAIRVSCAIAMALNPSLRTILIRNGSLLDSHGKQAIFDMAKAKGYQVWMEVCEEPRVIDGKEHFPAGFYLEHGHIAAINGIPIVVSEEVNP